MQTLKDAIVAKLVALINNPHTSGSGLVIGFAYMAELLWPDKKATFEAIRGAAAVWLGLNAGDAGKSATPQQLEALAQKTALAISTGDTTQLVKKDIPPALLPISPGKGPVNPS